MTDDIADRRRKELRELLINAALALAEYTQSAAFVVAIPCTEPTVYVAVGGC